MTDHGSHSDPPLDPKVEPLALISGLLDGRLGPAEVRQLERLVCEQPDVRRLYVRLLHQECVIMPHARLELPALGSPRMPDAPDLDAFRHGESMVLPALRTDAEETPEDLISPAPLHDVPHFATPWWRRPRVIAIAASLLIVVGVSLFLMKKQTSPVTVAVATIAGSAQAQWDGTGMPLQQGAALPASELRLRSGIVEIGFAGGARVLVEGPARFTATSANRISLIAGQLSAVVPGRAVGFTVSTPAGALVDLGTEFGVMLAPDGTAAVEVFVGKVRAEPRGARSDSANGAGQEKVLSAGEAARVSTTAVLPEPAQPQRFVRRLEDFSPTRAAIQTTTARVATAPSARGATIASAIVRVDLSTTFNRVGITDDGVPFSDGGIDGGGLCYSATQLSSLGSEFNFGGPGRNNIIAANGQTLALPEGRFSSLVLLGAGINGKKPDQQFVVRYADGSSQTFTQSLSNWNLPSDFAGETTLTMNSRNEASGKVKRNKTYAYRYRFALDRGKAVSSITLPRETQTVAVLGIDLIP